MEQMKGVNFGFMARRGFYSSGSGREEIDRICDAGVSHVALIVEMMQESYASTRVFGDYEYTASDVELVEAIRRFHAAGVNVMLKPMVECRDSIWRGRIDFPPRMEMIAGIVTDYAAPWFESYGRAICHYARLAEENSVELFCIGCELAGLEKQEKHWAELVGRVRGCYSGLLTYNCNQYTYRDFGFIRTWYRRLDLLGLSFYTGVGLNRPTAAEVAGELRPAVELLGELAEELALPLFFAETGARSVECGAREPWRYENAGDYDGEVQRNYMAGVLEAFAPHPWWKGFLWWKWDEHQARPHYHTEAGDTGFTIRRKPAERVFREWRAPQPVLNQAKGVSS